MNTHTLSGGAQRRKAGFPDFVLSKRGTGFVAISRGWVSAAALFSRPHPTEKGSDAHSVGWHWMHPVGPVGEMASSPASFMASAFLLLCLISLWQPMHMLW